MNPYAKKSLLLSLPFFILPLILVFGCSGGAKLNSQIPADAGSGDITQEIADNISNNISFDNLTATLITGEKPAEHAGDSNYPQITPINAPSGIGLNGQAFDIELHAQFSGGEISGAIMYVPPSSGYIKIEAKAEQVSKPGSLGQSGLLQYILRLKGSLALQSLSITGPITMMFGLYGSDGLVGNYITWTPTLVEPPDGGAVNPEDAGVIPIDDAGVPPVDDAGAPPVTDAGQVQDASVIEDASVQDSGQPIPDDAGPQPDGGADDAGVPPVVLYNLTLNINGTGTVTVDGEPHSSNVVLQFIEGTVLNIEALKSAGWSFEGWAGDLTDAQLTKVLTMSGNKTITASFILEPYHMPFTGTAGDPDKEGVAGWWATGAGPEPAHLAHQIPAPYDDCWDGTRWYNDTLAYYYIASPDYHAPAGAPIIAGSPGAGHGVAGITGFPNFQDIMAVHGLLPSNLEFSFGYMTLGNDVQGVDWTFVGDVETRFYTGGTFTLWVLGHPAVSCEMPRLTLVTHSNDHVSCLDDVVTIMTDNALPADCQDVSGAAPIQVQEAAEAFLQDLDLAGNIHADMSGIQAAYDEFFGFPFPANAVNGRTGGLFNVMNLAINNP